MPRRLMQSMIDSAFELGEAATNSAVTVAARLPILAECIVSPSAAGMAEWQRACSEKMTALWEGQIAAGFAWQAAAIRASLVPVTPMGMAQDTVTIMQEMSRPAHKAVRANAKRLTRR